MIRSIIFDVGGTYLEGSFWEFINKACRLLGIDGEVAPGEEIVFVPELNRGEIDIEEAFRRYFGVPISVSQMKMLKRYWTTTWAPTDEMTGLVRRLKKHYRLAILSNSDHLNSDTFRGKGWYSYFDTVVLSHEVGMVKPERGIYEILLDRLNLSPEECLFIDDQERVLETARRMGLKTIHFKEISQLRSDLKKHGIKF